MIKYVYDDQVDIRTWEKQNPAKFCALKVATGDFYDMVIPPNFTYGNYIFLRDVFFPVENDRVNIILNIREMLGDRRMKSWMFNFRRAETKMGPAFFLDLMFRPQPKYTYKFCVHDIQEPGTEPIFFKLHYRIITARELRKIKEDVGDHLEKRRFDIDICEREKIPGESA